jgi:hypothetical protein
MLPAALGVTGSARLVMAVRDQATGALRWTDGTAGGAASEEAWEVLASSAALRPLLGSMTPGADAILIDRWESILLVGPAAEAERRCREQKRSTSPAATADTVAGGALGDGAIIASAGDIGAERPDPEVVLGALLAWLDELAIGGSGARVSSAVADLLDETDRDAWFGWDAVEQVEDYRRMLAVGERAPQSWEVGLQSPQGARRSIVFYAPSREHALSAVNRHIGAIAPGMRAVAARPAPIGLLEAKRADLPI